MCSCFCFGKNSVHPVEINNSLKKVSNNETEQKVTIIKPVHRKESSKFDEFRNRGSEKSLPIRRVPKDRFSEEIPMKINIHENTKFEKKHKTFYELRDKFTCLLCGGKSCKHEDWTLHPDPAIPGLNSDQITDDIYASQRLSNRLIEQFSLPEKFLR